MIKYYDRKSKKYEVEKVAGNKYLKWVYSSPIGTSILELIVKKKLFSYLYGAYCDTKHSTKNISKFIDEFNMDMSLFHKNKEDFLSFNDFFARKLKSNFIDTHKNNGNVLISPCDGKLSAYSNIDINNLIQVKGFNYSLLELIKNTKLSEQYKNGHCLIFRLCPTDYHRFHFIDNGTCSKSTKINGYYYSVNPIALNSVKKLFCQNKREWSILHSENFKEVLYVEVGATCVGSIIQNYNPNSKVSTGDEKGYFKFGGSTIILFFKDKTIHIHEDILEQTKLGFETAVSFGEIIGNKEV